MIKNTSTGDGNHLWIAKLISFLKDYLAQLTLLIGAIGYCLKSVLDLFLKRFEIKFSSLHENRVGQINHKDFCANKWGHKNFHKYHDYADELIAFGLIQYTDDEKLRVCITEKGVRIGNQSSYL